MNARYKSIFVNTIKRYALGVDYSHKIENITFELTNLCNSKCNMCHIWANKKSPAQLNTDQVLEIFKSPALKNLKNVILTGGELFMRDDIVEIVEAIHSVNKDITLTLSTNGLLGEKIVKVAEEIFSKELPVVYGISLDGVGDNHDKRRRTPGNFKNINEIILPKLKKMRDQRPDLVSIGIGHCLDDYGIQTFDEVADFCKENDLSMLTQLIEDFDYYLPEKKQEKHSNITDWSVIHDKKLGFDGKNRILKKEIYQNAGAFKSKIKKLVPTVHNYRILRVLNGKSSKYECSSFRNFLLIKYDGEIAPCLRFSTLSLGNVKNENLSTVLDKSERIDAVKEIMKCDGCLNTWCTDWSAEQNAWPFKSEIFKWATSKWLRQSKQ